MIRILQERRPPARQVEVQSRDVRDCSEGTLKRELQLAGSDQPSLGSFGAAGTGVPRSVLARERARIARAMLADCHLCEHHCGVNRLAGETGLCHAGAEARIFMAQTEVSDELELIPTFAIALSGCDLRCDFCITGGPSWNPRAGEPVRLKELVERAGAALASGARTVMILGGEPTIHLPAVLEIVAALSERRPPARREEVGVQSRDVRDCSEDTLKRELQRAVPEAGAPKLVWKTNAHGSAQARELLDGMFDVWLADFKFGNNDCARRLAKVSDYVRIVRENLLWANEHSELIVRHLLMPGHVECCWQPVAEWLAAALPGVKVNLRSGFWPAWQAARHPELRGTVSAQESARAVNLAQRLGLNLVP
jgi:putative pyruvate formate lyase activating enzyme